MPHHSATAVYIHRYHTPAGFDNLLMRSDGTVLTGLWFEGWRDLPHHSATDKELTLPVFEETSRWLDTYFSGRQPDFTPAYRIDGLTPFRDKVLQLMTDIPFGGLTTYGSLSTRLANSEACAKPSARAVGGAVGWNPLCIIIPCHRVVGATGALTGYNSGLNNKTALLRLEGHTVSDGQVCNYSLPSTTCQSTTCQRAAR